MNHRWLKWLLFFGCWTLLSVISAGQSYVNARSQNLPFQWREAFAYAFTEWYSWAILTPLIIRLSENHPFDRSGWRRQLFLHLPAAAALPLLQLVIQAAVWHWIGPERYRAPSLGSLLFTMFSRKFHFSVLTYGAILGAGHALRYYRNYRDGELQRSQLSEQLAHAQLDVLKMQLHPHFLFNTLNTIAALVRRDPRRAEEMIARLGELLRMTLEGDVRNEVTLRQELDFLEKYLEIEQTRFHDRLTIDREIDPCTLEAQVPHLILQPIVENAIRHGIAKRAGAGRIRIAAERLNGSLSLKVCDDGGGLRPETAAETQKTSVGLANTRARLRQLYGEDHRFELDNAAGGGLEVSIVVPFRTLQATDDQTDSQDSGAHRR
ncbi:MAG TPA: histidine kinase [Blastocatellia bacterium]|nr:histidine kinase [Blastocatellia bacterium]